jgi:hypothetical protein
MNSPVHSGPAHRAGEILRCGACLAPLYRLNRDVADWEYMRAADVDPVTPFIPHWKDGDAAICPICGGVAISIDFTINQE